MRPEHKEQLDHFVKNDGIDASTRALVGAIFDLWTDSLNELIDEADADNNHGFANRIRAVAIEYGFKLDDSNMITPAIEVEEPK